MMKDAQISFEMMLAERAASVENLLAQLLDGRARAAEITRPERLIAAMRHGVLNGGKRLRPYLVMESAALFNVNAGFDAKDNEGAALQVGAALECVHCYSLIHDDLPAMDNDALRRGQPTVHKAFDEATAILAGDSLLTLAFDILATGSHIEEPGGEMRAQTRLELVTGLARAAGLGGMAGGQMLDLEAEKMPPDEAGIIRLQAMKTGALIRFACEAGAILSAAPLADRERMAEFGSAIGLAFQLADDLLDMTADVDQIGKATGKDAAAGKATLAALHGAEWARRQLHGLVDQAHALLDPYGERATPLKLAAAFVASRNR